MSELEARAAVVAEARTWLRTPYHPRGRVKGAGVDCGQILIAVYAAVGLIPEFDPGYYPADWADHNDGEQYLAFVMAHAAELAPGALPGPGDVALWKLGRVFHHGAIVVAWPTIIHAASGANGGVVLADAEAEARLAWRGDPAAERPRARKFFTLWPRP